MADQPSSSVWKQQIEMRAAAAGSQVRAVAQTVKTLAGDFRKEPGSTVIADAAERGADAIDRIGVYFEESEFDTLLEDAEAYSRDHPVVVAVAGVAIGIGVSRFIKATSARRAVDGAAARSESRAPAKPAKPRRPRVKKPANAG